MTSSCCSLNIKSKISVLNDSFLNSSHAGADSVAIHSHFPSSKPEVPFLMVPVQFCQTFHQGRSHLHMRCEFSRRVYEIVYFLVMWQIKTHYMA